MRWLAGFGAVVAAAAMLTPAGAADGEPPKVGDRAPDFKLHGSDGKEYTLGQFRGKQAVVIAWYPKAATRG
jgi:thioredoxin-dependent peroxiredoxin